mmetsp:Transcript_54407/g.80738  ORF Transcript_54407/g.80738 Transcript_54407/m.80738 type:complete len:184 (-) Transcript_54407:240-791(-)
MSTAMPNDQRMNRNYGSHCVSGEYPAKTNAYRMKTFKKPHRIPATPHQLKALTPVITTVSPSDKKTRKRAIQSEEERRQKRMAANRKSAAASRQRKLDLIEHLQKTISIMSNEISILVKQNNELRAHLNEVNKIVIKGIQRQINILNPPEHISTLTADAASFTSANQADTFARSCLARYSLSI